MEPGSGVSLTIVFQIRITASQCTAGLLSLRPFSTPSQPNPKLLWPGSLSCPPLRKGIFRSDGHGKTHIWSSYIGRGGESYTKRRLNKGHILNGKGHTSSKFRVTSYEEDPKVGWPQNLFLQNFSDPFKAVAVSERSWVNMQGGVGDAYFARMKIWT